MAGHERRLRVLLLVALACGGCANSTYRAWPVEPRNPTRWTFDIRKEDARTLILAAFGDELGDTWLVWDEPAEGEDIRLRAPTTWALVGPSYLSPVYHNVHGPCPMFTTFRLRLSAPSPERTTIEVIPGRASVITGKTSAFLRVHGPARIVKPAEPTTVEEYTILRRCGAAFGAHDMPETSVPAEGIEAIAARMVDDPIAPATTLTFLGGGPVIRCLSAILERGGKEAEEAAHVLGGVGTPAALPVLERALESPHWYVRDAAEQEIRLIRRAEPSLDELLSQLLSPTATDRLDAAIALVSTGREVDRARPVLEPFLASEIDSERWRAAAALVRLRRLPARVYGAR